jgi:hypothetical protein
MESDRGSTSGDVPQANKRCAARMPRLDERREAEWPMLFVFREPCVRQARAHFRINPRIRWPFFVRKADDRPMQRSGCGRVDRAGCARADRDVHVRSSGVPPDAQPIADAEKEAMDSSVQLSGRGVNCGSTTAGTARMRVPRTATPPPPAPSRQSVYALPALLRAAVPGRGGREVMRRIATPFRPVRFRIPASTSSDVVLIGRTALRSAALNSSRLLGSPPVASTRRRPRPAESGLLRSRFGARCR